MQKASAAQLPVLSYLAKALCANKLGVFGHRAIIDMIFLGIEAW